MAALALLGVPASAKASAPVVLAANGAWEVNYDNDACHLLRRFGTGEQASILRLTQYQPGDSFDLTLFGKPFKTSLPLFDLEVAFEPRAVSRKVEANSGTGGAKLPMILASGLRLDTWTYSGARQTPPSIDPSMEAATTAIDLRLPGGKRYRLQTGPLGKPMAALRTCLDDLVRHWGFDPAVQAALTKATSPIGNPGNWLTTNDYPDASLLSGHMGLVQFRLDIDEKGAVSGCRVLYRTNPDEFADLTCRVLARRAKLNPALDAEGKPVRSFYISKVRWIIPS